jgi:hypothetical protein
MWAPCRRREADGTILERRRVDGRQRDALVLRSSGVTEVAFTAVDLLQQVAVAVKPQEFEP